MLELWLIRHGQSTWNAERRIQGSSDPPLSDHGRQEARRLAGRLGGEAFDAVWSSDMQRALETARLSAPRREASICIDPRLREIDCGVFEGRLHEELTDDERMQYEVWYRGPFDRCVTGGESSDELRARVGAWLEELPAAGRVAVFSHGGAIGAMLQYFLGRPGRGAFTWGVRLRNTSITRLSRDGDALLVDAVNDVSHLEAWPAEQGRRP